MPPPISQAEISQLQVRLSGAHVQRYPLSNTRDDLSAARTRKLAEINDVRLEIRRASYEARYAREHNFANAQRLNERLVAELEERMAHLSREAQELAARIENTNRIIREVDQEINRLSRMLNLI